MQRTPRVQTDYEHGRPAREPQAEPRNDRSQHDRFSWVTTPIDNGNRRHNRPPSEAIPPLPTLPAALHHEPEILTRGAPTSAEYFFDHKAGPNTSQAPSVAYAPPGDVSNQQPRDEQLYGIDSVAAPGPGPIPTKVDPESFQAQNKTVDIVPDQNPLTPTTPSMPSMQTPTSYQPLSPPPSGAYSNHFPGQAPHSAQVIKGGTWKHGLWDCTDVSTCCTGLLCPCIMYGKTQHRLSARSEHKDPTNMLGYETLNGSCAVFAVLCGCNWILAAIQHSRVRKMYGIPGSVGSDCVRALCCCCCTLSQDEKEIKYREESARKDTAPAMSVKYASPGGMKFAAPPK